MAELVPYPFARLISRMFRELDSQGSIFDLPARKFVLGMPGRDLSVTFQGKTAATPLGPAAGPQSQMAQNLVLSFLGGGRIFELKTVQIMDELKIPRPCIDMQTVGYNVEWSQELKLEQSLQEYVKGSMLIEILIASGKLALAPGWEKYLFDMSVGYDLKGIQSARVQAFLSGMKDCSPVVEKLRAEIPPEYRQYRDLPFRTALSDSLTLSTFHGCPPDEIERMIDWLIREHGLHCIVKLNPTLLGAAEARRIFHEVLGYREEIPEGAFAKDTRWEQAAAFCERLGATAAGHGRHFGVKFSNTLIVRNQRSFFPGSEKEMYLSGLPLHVLAIQLVAKFRERFGDRWPVSFSAGIDRANFAEAVALGLTPVTVCSDLLRPGGYGRMAFYFLDLGKRMDAVGAKNLGELQLRAFGHEQEAAGEVAKARLLNTRAYAERLLADPRYRQASNTKLPPKVGTRLALFDCITCDKCVPVCPNDANFTYDLPRMEIPITRLRRSASGWEVTKGPRLVFAAKHQLANFADFCNECGNCDVFCPEDGGPYLLKPRFFGSLAEWQRRKERDGFFLDPSSVHGRFEGREMQLTVRDGQVEFSGPGFEVRFEEAAPESSVQGSAEGEVDLTWFHIMNWLRKGIFAPGGVNYLNA